ncbi:MAG: agenet domain-containing protein [Pyrinomonadaceae bacterium]
MKFSCKNYVLILFVSLVLSQFAVAQTSAWDPQRTWVFCVGLLEWKDSESFASFPKENRRDEIFLKVLKDRGVPASQVVYLQDRSATTARIKSEFIKLLARTQPGDTLIVYYEGHGYKDDNEKAFFASYNVSDENSVLGWPFSAVPDAIERYFKGSTAIIAMDNCYSGAMINAVNSSKRRVSYAVMASSSASQSSTGNWTFTEAIISAFSGEAHADTNRDGAITFAELEVNAKADMLFGEEQVASFAYTGTFDPNTKLADAAKAPSIRVGERVEAYSIDDWYKGTIIDAKNGKFLVHYYGYEQTDDEWVTTKTIRIPKVTSIYKIGEKVEVEWKKQWFAAHILNIKGGSHFVSYDDYDTDENEWVSSKRIRKIQGR